MTTAAPRRELATRNRSWARAVAAWLAARGVRPNAVSVASVVVAAITAGAFVTGWPLAAAAGIQLRLLCNMLDGMLAVEGGLKTKTGDIFNELPDRLADVVMLVGAGYALRELPHGPVLGWLAAVLALMTAYVRVLSGSLGLPQHFLGPMAKQHRMFVLTLGALAAAGEALVGRPPRAIAVALGMIVLGSAITTWRRAARLLLDAEAR